MHFSVWGGRGSSANQCTGLDVAPSQLQLLTQSVCVCACVCVCGWVYTCKLDQVIDWWERGERIEGEKKICVCVCVCVFHVHVHLLVNKQLFH